MRRVAILELPFRGREECQRLLNKCGLYTARVDPKHFYRQFPDGADLIIIPGSARTTCDLEYLRACGGESLIRKHLISGGIVVGICGGLQVLGTHLHDPLRGQGPVESVPGMGLLPITTVFGPEMMWCDTTAQLQVGTTQAGSVRGVERRSGVSLVLDDACARKSPANILHRGCRRHLTRLQPVARLMPAGPWQKVQWAPGSEETDGWVSEDRRIWGTYLHLIFDNECFVERLFAHVPVGR